MHMMSGHLKRLIVLIGSAPAKLLLAVSFAVFRVSDRFTHGHIAPIFEKTLRDLTDARVKVSHRTRAGQEVVMTFFAPNYVCRWRADSFSQKEPDTLTWLESNPGLTLWDVGANVGIYSIYYAKACNGEVFAFEPSLFNTRVLAKNIVTNGVADRVVMLPFALSDRNASLPLRVLGEVEGGALNSFGSEFGHDGFSFAPQLEFTTAGVRSDWLVHSGVAKRPNIIKIDVDGIEHLILSGMQEILQSHDCKSVLVEINDDFRTQHDMATKILESHGFKLLKKTSTLLIQKDSHFEQTYNQIWTR